MNCCSLFPLDCMSPSTSRCRAFNDPSFSLCSNSTYPFRIANGVFKSCAADPRALVVRWNRCCNSEYACGRSAGLGIPSPGTDMISVWPSPGSGTHKFFCTVAIGVRADTKGGRTRLVEQNAVKKSYATVLFLVTEKCNRITQVWQNLALSDRGSGCSCPASIP